MPPASPHAATPSPALRRLGELLVERHLATPADIGKALAFQQQFGGRIGSILVRLGALSEESLLPVLSEQLGIPLLDSSEWPVDAQAARVPLEASGIVADWWVDNDVIAWAAPDGQLLVAGRDPLDPMVNELLGQRLPAGWSWRLARAQDIERLVDLLARARRADEEAADDVSHLRELAEEAPVIELVNNILAQAMDQRASDIHIEPEEMLFHVRMRIDGILHTRLTLPASRYPAVASRVKLISGMDIAERRLPQDGRLSVRVSGQDVDVRVSSVPAVHGESLVAR
jgi:general secretion pathway protein E